MDFSNVVIDWFSFVRNYRDSQIVMNAVKNKSDF